MPATLEQLIAIESQLAQEVRGYLHTLAQDCAELPKYFPRWLRESSVSGDCPFDTIHQIVQVETREDLDERLREKAEQQADTMQNSHVHDHGPWRGQAEHNAKTKTESFLWDEEASKKHHRAVVLGDPGHGKSWLLRQEARRIALIESRKLKDKSASLDSTHIPLLVRLSELAKLDGPIEEALLSTFKMEHSHRFCSFIHDRLHTEQGCTVLLDAWDEVRTDFRHFPKSLVMSGFC